MALMLTRGMARPHMTPTPLHAKPHVPLTPALTAISLRQQGAWRANGEANHAGGHAHGQLVDCRRFKVTGLEPRTERQPNRHDHRLIGQPAIRVKIRLLHSHSISVPRMHAS